MRQIAITHGASTQSGLQSPQGARVMPASRIYALGPFLLGALIEYEDTLESSLGEYVRAKLDLDESHCELVWIVRDYIDALEQVAPEGVAIGYGPIFVHHERLKDLDQIRDQLLSVDLAQIATANHLTET